MRPRVAARLSQVSRRALGVVLGAAVLLASPSPASAGVEGEMQSFMSDMGVQANVTGPSAYQGQSAGYYSMGSVWSRFPQKNIQPFNIQLPHARAGCGGIDLFAGSFSFINTAELVAMLKATANNALGFAFKLAIDTISPEIGKVMDELAQKVQQMNQMNISSCETAQALVGGLWPKSDTASSVICEAIANSQGAVSDWARARQQCNNGGQREALKGANSDPDMKEQAGMPNNYTWEALGKKYGGFDSQFREFLMTLVGTVIYDPAGTGGKPRVQFIGPADPALISAMLDGTSATRTAETVFVMPAVLNYSNGGFVYGARMWDKVRGFEVRDPVFKANLDGYLKQCAYYDILLGTKSLKLLSEAPDLWAELGVDAATNRGMKYLTDTGAGTVDIEGKTCAQAWTLINNQWDTQINAYALPFAHSMYPKLTEAAAGAKLAADVPVVSQLLTGTAMTRNQFFKQKSMVDAFEAAQLDFGNADADSFALQRADTQTRNAMTTAAEQGLIWIPVLGVVLTVVFYALFPIVFPLLLFPRSGIATLKGYFSGFFYLSAWGPIYVLIHSFVMDRLASQTNAVSAGSVNLANWAGIDAVNQDVATMAGFLMMSVPVLALMVMRGTMSVANNLGSMLAPVQAGSDAAALERTTGNYAYGDVSYGNLNAENRQMSQWNMAPNLISGAGHSGFREADGRMFNEYGSGHRVIDTNAAMSQLPFKPTMTSGYATDLRSQGQWYLSEADKIENGTSTSWTSSKGRFGSAVTATSDVSGRRRESGSRASDTHNVGGNVVVEGAKGSSTRDVTNNDVILREGNSRSYGDFASRTFGSSASLTGSGTMGTPGKDIAGSGLSATIQGSIFGRKEIGDDARAGTERSATNQTTRGTDKSEETSDRVVVSGSSGDIESSGTYSQSSEYGDHSHSRTNTDGNDWRVAEAEDRRAAAARYREIGSRMMSEASYAESHGFQVSSDMSNLIQDRYEALQREHPEWHLPDLSNPRLDYRDVTRRDQAITYIMDDLMGDLRAHRINELGDVAAIAGLGSLGTNTSLGMPQAPSLPEAARAEGLVPSPLEGGTLLAVPEGPVDGAAYARNLGMMVKPGARLGRMDGELVPAMGVVAEEARALGLPAPVVTSGNDSTQHMAGSAHYADRALDFRGNNISDEQGERWATQVRSRLGDGYAVQFERFPDRPERDHLHVARKRS